MSQECAKLEEENDAIRLELKLETNKNEMLNRKNERLQQELATFKEQCSFYLNERENVMRERDQLVREHEDVRKYNRELQQSRDEAVNKQVEISLLLGEYLLCKVVFRKRVFLHFFFLYSISYCVCPSTN